VRLGPLETDDVEIKVCRDNGAKKQKPPLFEREVSRAAG
jgi:hypothetical protein